MTKLTKQAWATFSPKQQWDVMAAFRGPDLSLFSENVKWFSTSVIRGKMSEVLRVGGAINTDLNLIVVPIGYSLDATGKKSLRFSSTHFYQHVSEAADILSIPILYLKPERYVSALKQADPGYPSEFGAAVYKNAIAQAGDLTSFLPTDRKKLLLNAEELARHLTNQWGISLSSLKEGS